VLGFLDVDISLSRQSAGMRAWAEMAGIATFAQFALIAVGVAIVLGFVVVRPVRRLERAMSDVRHGNYDVVAAPAGTRELDSLVVGFNEMVSRLKRADELEQDAQRTRMVRAEQMATMGEWAAGLAHELRNPLSGIKAALDVLAGEERAEEPRRILQHASSELSRVDGVVRQLLNYARPKAPALGQVDLRSVLTDAVMLSRPRANANRTSLESTLPAEAVQVLADAEMVQQVVLNLILNALEATDGGPEPRVVVSAEVQGGQAWCRVRDNGPGVPSDRMPTLFRPFTTTKARGTGLGLATSLRLIELQGGQLILENPGEHGASFAFSLPLFSGTTPA
jgi:two-component system NtrC family sensor kinase